jgi:lipopolysaccharide transport system ATP-binding protein
MSRNPANCEAPLNPSTNIRPVDFSTGSDIVIRVDNLSKKYIIGHQRTERYQTFRDNLAAGAKDFARKLLHPFNSSTVQRFNDSTEEFFALKDVSFEVKRGDQVGIIGRNGAGKSTLLKILSRITEPTSGRIEIDGRVASLLEVGTGFHPELTGRENIFLNGAILGMTREEIKRKFDEIVAFAEIEKFLDTPVKRYSSGMYVRLAFAVAAHLEPEILIVDEVLAVGDAQFQKKCLGKMEEVGREGRTVLFVSHQMAAVQGLCTRGLLLHQGYLTGDADVADTVRQYIEIGKQDCGETVWADSSSAPGNDNIRLHAVRFVSKGAVTSDIDIDTELRIEIEFWNLCDGANITTSIHLLDQMGSTVLASANMHSANLDRDEWFGKPHVPGLYKTSCIVPGNFLNEGRYSINAIVLTDLVNPQVYAKDVLSFNVHEAREMRKEYSGKWIGVVRPKLAWSTNLMQSGVGEKIS